MMVLKFKKYLNYLINKKNDFNVNPDENDYTFLNNKLAEIKTTIALLEKIISK